MVTRSSAGRQLRTRARPAMSTPRNCCCSNFAQDQALSGRPKETDGLPHPRSLVTQRSERRSYRSRVLKGEEPICAAEILSRSCRLWVRHGHSAMSVQCPTCPKADGGARFSLWQPPLAPREVPRRDPAEPRLNAPEVTAQRRAARLARQRARNATQHPTARPREGMQTAAQEPVDWSTAVLIKSRTAT